MKEFWKTWHLAANWKLGTVRTDDVYGKIPSLLVCMALLTGKAG